MDGRFTPNHPRSNRIKMNVITYLSQIFPSAPIHQERLVTSAKQMPRKAVPPIEALRVGTQKPLHSGAQIASGRLHDQMKMISHQAIGMNLPTCPAAGAFQNLEKQLSIRIVSDNGFSPVAPAQHMIEGARILNSQWSSHGAEPDRNGELCQYLALTPFCFFGGTLLDPATDCP